MTLEHLFVGGLLVAMILLIDIGIGNLIEYINNIRRYK